MSKKLLQILKRITKDYKEKEFYAEELLDGIEYDDSDLVDISRELEELEFANNLSEDELDILRALLAYILLRDSSYEKEDIFALVFGGGRRIVWN